jgi:predicted  nucleic acid-binding Zn-ribbon protein
MSSNLGRHIGTARLALAVSSGLMLAGCFGPDYPTEGRLDTQVVTDRAKVVDVRGHVYGVKEGTIDLVATYEADEKALREFEHSAWTALINDQPVGDIAIDYPLESGFDASAYRSRVIDVLNADLEAITAEVNEERNTVKTQLATEQEKLAAVEKSREAYNTAVEAEQAEYNAIKAKLEETMSAYRQTTESMKADISKLIADSGLSNRAYRGNPLSSYRVMTFDGQPPASCPNQRFYLEIDVREERGECVLVNFSEKLNPLQPKISALLAPYYVKIKNLEATMGDKGSWGSDPTGLYADLEQAEQSVQQVARQAANEHGSKRDLDYQERILTRKVESLEQKLAEIQPEAYLMETLKESHSYGTDADLAPMLADYEDAVEKNLATRFVKDSPMTFLEEQETGRFEDLSGGYEAAVYMGVVVAEAGGRRDAQELVITTDLTDPAVLEADEIVLSIDRDAVRNARRLDLDDQEDINETLLDMASDLAEARSEAKG